MTAIRKSVSIAPETGAFGSGTTDGTFYALPYGAYFTHTARRDAESIYATGSKRRQAAAYGRFSGQGQLDFVMDYAHIHILEMIFDGHFVRSTSLTYEGHVCYEHKFTKENNTRVPHFVICEKILNEIAGGDEGSDEVDLIKGFVAKSITISRTMSGSQMTISLSGIYCDQEVRLGGLESTDYTDPIGELTQYSCMFVDERTDDGYVKDVDSHSITLDMELGLIYNTCSPIADAYYEGKTTFSWNAQTYSNNPQKKFQLRSFSGGMDSDHMQPAAKEMGPMEEAYFITYSDSIRDNSTYNGSRIAAINASPFMFEVKAIKSTVTSMTWPNGNGQKMMDVLSSIECNAIEITIRTIVAPPTGTAVTSEFTRIDSGNWDGAQTVTSTEGITPNGWNSYTFMDYNLTNVSVAGGDIAAGATASMPSNTYFTANSREKYNIKSGMLKIFNQGDQAAVLTAAAQEGWMIVPKASQGRTSTVTLNVLAGGDLSDVGDITDTSVNVANTFAQESQTVTGSGATQTTTTVYKPTVAFTFTSGATAVAWPAGATGTRITKLYYAVKANVIKTVVGAGSPTYKLDVTDHAIVKVWIDKVN